MITCKDFSKLEVKFSKVLYIVIVLYWQQCERSTAGYYLDYGKIGGEQLSNIWPVLKIPDAFSGQFYQTHIALSNLSDYDIRFLVTKVGSQELPAWLKYENINYSLTGIPLASDIGVHPLFVLAMQLNETTPNGELLGAQTVAINVLAGNNRSYCEKGVNFVVTEVSLAVNGILLNSTQRIELYQWFVTEFDLSQQNNSIYFKHEPKRSNVTGCEVLKSYETNMSYGGPVLKISWLVGCHLINVSEPEQLRDVVLNYPVISWRILTGNDSTLCFPDAHKSSSISSYHLKVNKNTYTPPVHPSSLLKKTSVTSMLSSTMVNQQVPQTTASFQSNPVILSTKLTNNFSSGIHKTVDQMPFTPVPQSTINLSYVKIQNYSRKNTSVGLENTLIATRSFHIELVTSTLDSIRSGQYASTHVRSEMISPTTTFTVPEQSRSKTITSENTDPVIRSPLPILNITTCQYLYYKIPQDTFWDKEDGSTLTLRLLTNSFRELSNDSWIKLDPTSNVLYGVPVYSQIFGKNSTRVEFTYHLSAMDTSHRAVNTSVVLAVDDDLSPVGQKVSIEVNMQSISSNSIQLIQDISDYLYNGDKATMKILSLSQSSQKINLTWSDCKAISDVCDVSRVERTSQLIRIDESFLNPHFVIALVPNFVLSNAQVQKLGMCLNEPPEAQKMSIHFNITCCGKFWYNIPHDLFYDQEDGDTRDLTLSIRFSNTSKQHSKTWIMLNNTSKSLQGVIMLEEAQKNPEFDEFFIVAQDSGRLEAKVSVVITVRHPLPMSSYFVSLFIKRLHIFATPLEEVLIIIQKLSLYFDGETLGEVRALSYSRENAITVFTWSLADLRLKPCDLDAISNISKKLKEADGQVNDGFRSIMNPEFEVQFIFEEKLGHCKEGANEQPNVVIPFHRLRVNLTYFEYKIPAHTFNDLEDGNSANLRLSLLLSSFESLPVGSWIVLNSETQIIYGLPDEDAIQAQPMGGYRYLLVGQDSGGKIASSSVLVQLPDTTPPYNYQITAYLRSYLDASLPCVNQVVEFLGKLSRFIGEDKENIRVISYNISKNYPADVTISWTNRSASFNTCDHEIIKKRFREFINEESEVTRSFSDVLLPYFIVQDIKLKFLETCKNAFSNTPPVLFSPLEILNVPVYELLQFYLPPTMFYDVEDGYTRNLTVFALDTEHKPFNSSSWIQFDSATQLLYGLPTLAVVREQPTRGYVMHVVAKDTNSNAVNSTTRIVVNDTVVTVHYLVKIGMIVNTSFEYSDTDLVLNFLTKIKTFLGNSDIIVMDYLRNNSNLKIWVSTLHFLEPECNFAALNKLQHHLLFQKVENTSEVIEGMVNYTDFSHTAQPNENFTRAMLPDFLISSAMEEEKGPCSNTPPVVLQSISHFIISTPGLFFIALSSNIFYDREDGFTSNLSLTLLSSSGQVLPPDSWLQLNDNTDEIYGVVTEKLGLNKNFTFILNAEDSYGLKVNTSFTIEVMLDLQDIGFKVNMIFKNNFSFIVPHVDIVTLLFIKMASHYPGNITLNILSFERGSGVPSTDILSWTVTELDSENCDLEQLHGISKKARSRNNEPNEGFKDVLLPEFELLLVFEQRLGSCADSLNSLPTVIVPVFNLNISWVPTVFHYRVPRDVFHDAEDGDTRNLTLTFLGEDNEEILRNSSVQFNTPLQMLYGIFTESDLDIKSRVVKRNIDSTTSIKRFIILAMDSGGKTARSIIEINLGNNIISQNYEVHLTFISYLSSTSPDVMHLINFQEKVRGFEAFREMQVSNYARSSGYPAKFEVSFINASSHINQSCCDFAEIFRITETFQDSPSKPKTEFTTRFLPEFVIQEFDIQRFGPCLNLPNNPPIVNRVIPVINITVCEVMKYQLPDDVFLDEDGNTRNLSLKLEGGLRQERNIHWIFLDHPSQTLYAVPFLDVVGNQQSGGYVFRLIATDSHGENARLNFNVSVRDTVVGDSYRLSVVVQVPSLIITKEDLVLKTIEFIEATKRYLSGLSANDIRVVEFQTISESLLKITWSNCSLRYTPCDYHNIEKIRQAMIHTGTLPQPRFIQSLAPAFIVDSVKDEMRGPCLNQRPVVMHKLEPFNVTLCDGLFEYSLPYNTFFDAEDGYTPNLTLSILNSNSFPLPGNYWISIQESQSIIAYPNVDALKTQPKSGYEFLVNARDSYSLSANLPIKVFYEEEQTKQSNYEVTFVLHAQFANMTRFTDQVQAIFQILVGYMGGSEKFIRVHSFQRAGENSTTLFFTWSNCTLSSENCDLLGIVEISKRLKDTNGQISEQLKEAFMPYFVLEFVFEQRLGVCIGDTNVRPKVKHALYQLTVENFCGLWEFEIPPNFFDDAEDGGTRNLTLSLKTINSMEIPVDSWIQLDQETQTLFGFPLLSNSSNSSSPTKELFILIAADSQGKLATMKLEILVNNKIPNVHYKVLVEMTSFVEESLSAAYQLKRFVERLSLFLKAETRAIMVTNYERRTSSRLSVTWTNCSVAVNMCNINQINILRGKLHQNKGVVGTVFSQSMLPYFVVNSVSLEKFRLCRIEAMKSPPRLVRPVGRIFAYSGSLLRYQIPEDIFIDEEDGNALNLSLVLQFSNKAPVPSSYWLKFDNPSLLITGVLLVENSWEHSFRLVARDQHDNEAVDTFELFVQRRCPKTLLSYQVFTEFVYTGNEESLNTKFLRKLEVYFQKGFSDTNFTLLSTTAKANNTFQTSWSHAKTCGLCFKVNSTLQAISENITDINGTVLLEFKTAFLPEFILVNISEEKCIPSPGTPIIKGGKEDRWKLYAVPIIVLLIFLLLSFIFFICRGFVFPYESTKEEVILDESPVSEILVRERIRPTQASMYNSSSTTIINEGYVGNIDAIGSPEILLDKRVSPSKSSLPQDVPSVSTQDVEPVVAPTPPLYSDAVLHLAVESARKPESPIEMQEIPVIKREVAPTSQAIPISETMHLDERVSSESNLLSETSDVDGAPHSKPDDTWSTFDYEESPISLRNRLRLPTPPEVGTLRLPPVPKPLSNTSPLSMENTPNSPPANTPYSPASSAYATPLVTPSYSQTTVNNTYNERQTRNIRSPPEVSPNNYPNPPAYSAYGYGNPMRERTELGIQSPMSYVTPSPLRERTQLGIQSPLGFPFPQGRVPYVDHRQQGPPPQSRPSDLHNVLGQLRETVNREFDRRNEVDKYLDQYLNKN